MDQGRRPRLIAACVALVVAAPVIAHADGSGSSIEPTDRQRAFEAARLVALGGAYLGLEFGLSSELSPKTCRWCDPDAFDLAMTDALGWRDPSLANNLSTASGYVLAPVAAATLLVGAGWGHGWRRGFDDVAPVIESAIVASLLQHATKLLAARQRPYAYFNARANAGIAPTEEDNVSLWSGHSSLTFALATSAGEVAEMRGYSWAPAIWATGMSLATITGYLRVAADKHWTTDVLTGAEVGSLVGYFWPRLYKISGARSRDGAVAWTIAPTANGLALSGGF